MRFPGALKDAAAEEEAEGEAEVVEDSDMVVRIREYYSLCPLWDENKDYLLIHDIKTMNIYRQPAGGESDEGIKGRRCARRYKRSAQESHWQPRPLHRLLSSAYATHMGASTLLAAIG